MRGRGGYQEVAEVEEHWKGAQEEGGEALCRQEGEEEASSSS